jgi:hypothetical protein
VQKEYTALEQISRDLLGCDIVHYITLETRELLRQHPMENWGKCVLQSLSCEPVQVHPSHMNDSSEERGGDVMCSFYILV